MPTVLVVDESHVDQRLVAEALGTTPDLNVEFAENGCEALDRINANSPDLVITDLVMPEMNGVELLASVKRLHPLVPVVLITSIDNEELAEQAVEWGALAYVPKTAIAKLLPGIVKDLLTLANEQREASRLLESIAESETSFVLKDNDTSLIAHLLEYAGGCLRNSGVCEEGAEDLICLALEEALRNAVHHGNLELSSELRDMFDEELFEKTMNERRRLSPYCDRNVYVKIKVSSGEVTFVVRDDGEGFDPSEVPDPTTEEGLEAVSGRGILLMQSLMDEVTFSEKGNEVTLVKRRAAEE